MRLVVDTGVFSAMLSHRRQPRFDALVMMVPGNQVCLAAQSVAELRYGALVAGWGASRRSRLEQNLRATNLVRVTDGLVTIVAEVRYACRRIGHPLADGSHNGDLWIAATAIEVGASLLTADRIFQGVPGVNVM